MTADFVTRRKAQRILEIYNAHAAGICDCQNQVAEQTETKLHSLKARPDVIDGISCSLTSGPGTG